MICKQKVTLSIRQSKSDAYLMILSKDASRFPLHFHQKVLGYSVSLNQGIYISIGWCITSINNTNRNKLGLRYTTNSRLR